jgi:hypothetical protein
VRGLDLPLLHGVPDDDPDEAAEVEDEEELDELVRGDAPPERLVFVYKYIDRMSSLLNP